MPWRGISRFAVSEAVDHDRASLIITACPGECSHLHSSVSACCPVFAHHMRCVGWQHMRRQAAQCTDTRHDTPRSRLKAKKDPLS